MWPRHLLTLGGFKVEKQEVKKKRLSPNPLLLRHCPRCTWKDQKKCFESLCTLSLLFEEYLFLEPLKIQHVHAKEKHQKEIGRRVIWTETYCWWTKSFTTKDDDYPIGFQPSQVVQDFFYQPYLECFEPHLDLYVMMDLRCPTRDEELQHTGAASAGLWGFLWVLFLGPLKPQKNALSSPVSAVISPNTHILCIYIYTYICTYVCLFWTWGKIIKKQPVLPLSKIWSPNKNLFNHTFPSSRQRGDFYRVSNSR